MNEELQSQLSQILNQITTSIGEAKDFSVSQLPDVAQQYIAYGVRVHLFQAIISAVVFLLLLKFSLSLYKKSEETKKDGIFSYSGDYIIGSFFVGLFSILSLSNLMSNVHDLILITSAPKVWFILEIKNLIS